MQLSFIQVILPHRSNDIETSSSHTPCNLPGNGKSVARQVGKLYFNFYITVTVQNKLQTQSITTSDTSSSGLKHCKTLHQIGITRCPSVSVPPSLNSWLGLSLHFVLGDILWYVHGMSAISLCGYCILHNCNPPSFYSPQNERKLNKLKSFCRVLALISWLEAAYNNS